MNIPRPPGSFSVPVKGILCTFVLSALLLSGCSKTAMETEKNKPAASDKQTALISVAAVDPTSGWTQTSYTYDIQTPWNLSQSSRYSYSAGEHHLSMFT